MKLSEGELEFIAGTPDPRNGLQALWHDRLELAVVTHSENGCTCLTPDFMLRVESFEVDCVDPTGAGNGFVAGLPGRIAADPDCVNDPERISSACRFANAVGALTVSGRGGNSGASGASRCREIDERVMTEPSDMQWRYS